MAKMNKKLITLFHTLPSMGMAFIVLGVLLMVASFAFPFRETAYSSLASFSFWRE